MFLELRTIMSPLKDLGLWCRARRRRSSFKMTTLSTQRPTVPPMTAPTMIGVRDLWELFWGGAPRDVELLDELGRGDTDEDSDMPT